jgi:hypothetical protein
MLFETSFDKSELNIDFLSSNATALNPLLIEFERLNERSQYFLSHQTIRIPLLPVDTFRICLRSVLHATSQTLHTCHDFYAVTRVNSTSEASWPVLILFGYVSLLFIGILVSVWKQCKARPSQTLRLFLHKRHSGQGLIKTKETREIQRAIDKLAHEYQLNQQQAFSITGTRRCISKAERTFP